MVLLGISTFAALALYTHGASLGYSSSAFYMSVAATVMSYLGAVFWAYEKLSVGKLILAVVSVLGLATALSCTNWAEISSFQQGFVFVDLVNSAMLIGLTLTAMFLGHWYLNTPSMQLKPLRQLVLMMGIALAIRAIVGTTGLVVELQAHTHVTSWWLMLSFRWLSGIIGAGVLLVLTWYTLKIPNTQSATGILYAAVIVVFLGELTSQLLSRGGQFPL